MERGGGKRSFMAAGKQLVLLGRGGRKSARTLSLRVRFQLAMSIARQRLGDNPYARLNWRVIWLWTAKPQANAASARECPARTRNRTWSRRRIVRHRYGLVPNRGRKWRAGA